MQEPHLAAHGAIAIVDFDCGGGEDFEADAAAVAAAGVRSHHFSILRSGMIHMMATRTYTAIASHACQRESAMPQAENAADKRPFLSVPMACASFEAGPLSLIRMRARMKYAIDAMSSTNPYVAT